MDLTSATIGNGVTYISEGLFLSCKNLTSINIPESVTKIGREAFKNCLSLTSITIPDGVTPINYGAFFSCEYLTEITYTGTQEQWNAIQGLADACILSGCIVHCTDGDITIN